MAFRVLADYHVRKNRLPEPINKQKIYTPSMFDSKKKWDAHKINE